MSILSPQQRHALHNLLVALIHQEKATVLIPPYASEPGFWFGGGNMVQGEHGTLWLCGRYRNYGDSRTGLGAGQRGLECALFRSDDGGESFIKARSWSKADLSFDNRHVLSIEGTALHRQENGSWELFVSSEKDLSYPDDIHHYQKPGTGVWTVDRLTGASVDTLDTATIEPVLENDEYPAYLHIKDPVVFDQADGTTALIFCSHPYSWTSTNSGLATRVPGGQQFAVANWEIVSRGATWDVAATRITGQMRIPKVGLFAGQPDATLYFYDGAECLRPLEENQAGYKRPRGYSCEEIGGVLFGWDNDFPHMERLSMLEPLFISPNGTGASRYTDVLVTNEMLFATWEQSQADGSQPLVGHTLSKDEVQGLLE
ncbi:MAG: exo-alpha-sialidase [Chloroflexota bacterium]